MNSMWSMPCTSSVCKSSREAMMSLMRTCTVPRFVRAVMLLIASSTRIWGRVSFANSE